MEELMGGLGQALPGVVGGLLANQQNQENAQNMFNQSAALSNTALERQKADATAAGINEIALMPGGGAPGASGAVPPMQNAMQNVGAMMQGNRQQDQTDTAQDIQQQQTDVAQQNADTQAKKTETDNANTEEHTRMEKNINDSIESVLPYFKKGLGTFKDAASFLGTAAGALTTPVPDLIKMRSNP